MATQPTDPPPLEPSPHGALEDEQFFCPICHYNLSGLPSGRCPECGSLYDREQLRRAQLADEVVLIPWDDPEVPSRLDAFWATVRITCGQPQRFAYAFSVQAQNTQAASYFWLCMFLAWGAMAAAAGLLDMANPRVAASGQRMAGPMLAGLLTAVVAGLVVWPIVYTVLVLHADGRRHYRPWLAIVYFSAGHLLLFVPLVVVLAPACLFLAPQSETQFYFAAALFAAACGVFLLWWCTLSAVLGSRAPQAPMAQLAALLTLLLGPVVACATWGFVTLIVDELLR